MIFGSVQLDAHSLHTHRDSYVLSTITAVSTRRPWCGAGLSITALCSAFGLAFHDLLSWGELLSLATTGIVSSGFGLTFGQLRLLSRDLRGSELSDAIYGTHWALSALRLRIIHTVEIIKSGEPL